MYLQTPRVGCYQHHFIWCEHGNAPIGLTEPAVFDGRGWTRAPTQVLDRHPSSSPRCTLLAGYSKRLLVSEVKKFKSFPADTRLCINVGLTLVQRRRRWNIVSTSYVC